MTPTQRQSVRMWMGGVLGLAAIGLGLVAYDTAEYRRTLREVRHMGNTLQAMSNMLNHEAAVIAGCEGIRKRMGTESDAGSSKQLATDWRACMLQAATEVKSPIGANRLATEARPWLVAHPEDKQVRAGVLSAIGHSRIELLKLRTLEETLNKAEEARSRSVLGRHFVDGQASTLDVRGIERDLTWAEHQLGGASESDAVPPLLPPLPGGPMPPRI